MKFDVDFKLLKKLLFENRIAITTILIVCILIGTFFSIKNSFTYIAKTSLLFGRIKPEEKIVSNIVQTNPVDIQNSEAVANNEDGNVSEEIKLDNTEITTSNNTSPEKNVSLTNVNIDSNTLKTCQTLIKSDNLVDKLKETLHLEDSSKKIKQSLSISRIQDSNVLLIAAENSDANKACDIANGMAQVFSEEVKLIYNLDNVYIIDSVDYNDVYKTGFNAGYLVLWILIGIILDILFLAIKQFKIIDSTIDDIVTFFKNKITAIKDFINSKIHKVEIRELPSGEELDENYKVVSNKSIVDSDFVPSEQPKIDSIISTDIEEFNSKMDLFDESVSKIPIADERENKEIVQDISTGVEKTELLRKKNKKNDKKDELNDRLNSNSDKKITKKIGKEEAESIRAQEELIALREENNQKMREERNKFESQAQIQKRLNDEIEARKKLEDELENQRKSMQEERRVMEEQIRKEIQKQIKEEQRILQEEEEKIALEIELQEQEEEQRIMEEERLKMLREKEERKEKQRQERMERRIIKAEIRKQKAEERAKQRAIANEERARRQAIKREEKIKLHNQREAERQEILRKYYEEKNNKQVVDNINNNEFNEDINYISTNIEENKVNNYSTIEPVKEKPIKRKELSEDFIQDNLYPKFKI